MKNVIILIVILAAVGILGFLYFQKKTSQTLTPLNNLNKQNTPSEAATSSGNPKVASDTPLTSVIAENLDTPWALDFLPNRSILVTERAGRVILLDTGGQVTTVAQLSTVLEIGEGGLLGLALHPKFSENSYLYLYYTYSGSGDNTLNRVVRMTFKDNQLTDEKIIVDQIPGAANHNGGRIKFGPSGLLYITTGDAQEPSLAQSTNTLAGKILRVTDEGKPAPGNPYGNAVYSYGHRNPQGIVWDENGELWETEHGPSGGSLGSGNDEVNLIKEGRNYGWPEIQGDQTKSGMEIPARHSGTSTWAPAGAAFINNSLFFAGLRGQALYQAKVQDGKIQSLNEHFKGELGRIREVIKGPDNMLYITTSNRDGRGTPKSGDDKILKINPNRL